MKPIPMTILGAGAMVALALLYNGWQERLQADCHAMVQIMLGEDRWGLADPYEWAAPEVKAIRDGVAHALRLTDGNRAYCNW